MVRVQLTLEAPDHVIGIHVAGRFEVFGGVKLDAFAQMERVGQAVIADVPRLGQRRDHSVVPGLKSTSRLKMVSATASAVTAVVYCAVSKPSGLASVQTTRGLADTPTATLNTAQCDALRNVASLNVDFQ